MKRKESEKRSPRTSLSLDHPSSIRHFIISATLGEEGAFKRWIQRGIDVDTQDVGGTTALHAALHHVRASIVSALLDKYHCNPNVVDDFGFTGLHVALLYCDDPSYPAYEFAKALLRANANVNSKTSDDHPDKVYRGVTPLHLACMARNMDICELLIEHGADLGLRDAHHQMAFDETICGADFNSEFKEGFKNAIEDMKNNQQDERDKMQKLLYDHMSNLDTKNSEQGKGDTDKQSPVKESLIEIFDQLKSENERLKKENNELRKYKEKYKFMKEAKIPTEDVRQMLERHEKKMEEIFISLSPQASLKTGVSNFNEPFLTQSMPHLTKNKLTSEKQLPIITPQHKKPREYSSGYESDKEDSTTDLIINKKIVVQEQREKDKENEKDKVKEIEMETQEKTEKEVKEQKEKERLEKEPKQKEKKVQEQKEKEKKAQEQKEKEKKEKAALVQNEKDKEDQQQKEKEKKEKEAKEKNEKGKKEKEAQELKEKEKKDKEAQEQKEKEKREKEGQEHKEKEVLTLIEIESQDQNEKEEQKNYHTRRETSKNRKTQKHPQKGRTKKFQNPNPISLHLLFRLFLILIRLRGRQAPFTSKIPW